MAENLLLLGTNSDNLKGITFVTEPERKAVPSWAYMGLGKISPDMHFLDRENPPHTNIYVGFDQSLKGLTILDENPTPRDPEKWSWRWFFGRKLPIEHKDFWKPADVERVNVIGFQFNSDYRGYQYWETPNGEFVQDLGYIRDEHGVDLSRLSPIGTTMDHFSSEEELNCYTGRLVTKRVHVIQARIDEAINK